MFRLNRSEFRHRRRIHRRTIFDFTRKPAFQLGVVIFVAVVVLILALNGQKPSAQPSATLPPGTVQAQPVAQTTFTQPPVTAQSQPAGTSLPGVISVSQAYDMYRANSAYLLDVRERSEWDQFHIPGSTLLPLGQVAALINDFPKDKPIIVLSGPDSRSQQARDILIQGGLTNVTSMAGGIVFWRTQGYPIEP